FWCKEELLQPESGSWMIAIVGSCSRSRHNIAKVSSRLPSLTDITSLLAGNLIRPSHRRRLNSAIPSASLYAGNDNRDEICRDAGRRVVHVGTTPGPGHWADRQTPCDHFWQNRSSYSSDRNPPLGEGPAAAGSLALACPVPFAPTATSNR